MRNAATIAALCLGTVLGGRADAEMYGGIEFPSGAASFADEVMAYDDDFLGFGNPPTDPKFNHPDRALGIPDYSGGPDGTGAVALGQGGLLELLFTDNVVTNSGDSVVDLVVFEVGPQEENSYLALRPADSATSTELGTDCIDVGPPYGDGFCELGIVPGGTRQVDLDAAFPGRSVDVLRFDAIQLIDDPNQGNHTGTAIGADIDAVGAVHSGTIACGDGRIEGAEECDDGGTLAGDGCSVDCSVEVCWVCAGEPSDCDPTVGGPCEDGDACTVSDTCSGGTCVGGPPPVCDDDNVCTDDSCVTPGGCVYVPNDANPCDLGSTCSINDHCGGGQCIGDAVAAPDCLQPIDAGSPFRMQDGEDDARDALAWKWHKGQETKLGDFGDPVDGSGDYELCVFDQPEGVLRLQLSVSVPKGGVCDDKPCWKLRGTKGYAYKDRQASKGIKTIILKAGVDGKAKVLVKGKGAELGMAALPLADPGANPVRVQLKDAGTGRCWEALYGEAIQNDTTRFKAKY